MRYRIIAFDLDGTLTDSKKRITKATKESIHLAAKLGITICLASGRPLIGIQKVAKYLELDKLGGYVIAYNGGLIFDCKQKKAIYKKILPRQYYTDICYLAKQYQVQAITYDGCSVVAENAEDVYVQREAYNNSVGIRQVDHLIEYISYPVIKFMAVGEPKNLTSLYKFMNRQYRDILDVYFSEPYFLEIMPAETEKALALKWILEKLHYEQKELMAFGDGFNDIPMLKYAGFAVAMENAYQDVKKQADYITLSNDEDGVAQALKVLILKGQDKENESFFNYSYIQ